MRFLDEAGAAPAGLRLVLKSAALALGFVVFVWPQLGSSWDAALRYRDGAPDEYINVPTWLESAQCARRTGAWAALCRSDGMAPLLADDPGHAILLGYWSRIVGRDLNTVDVARLNLMIDFAGLVVLVATMLALGRFWTALVLVWLGPPVFLVWFGAAAHWSLIGVLAMQLTLPLGIIAAATRSVPVAVSAALIVCGLPLVALAALIREPIGWMSLFVSLAALLAMAFRNRRNRSDIRALSVLGVLVVLASQAAQISMAVRDSMYGMDTSRAVATHGVSHNLYLGLGVVPNRWGITYTDKSGLNAAKRAVPGTQDYSRDYYRIIRGLYFAKVLEDPLEVARIYFEKLRIFLAPRIIDMLPPLWLFLMLTVGIQAVAWIFLAAGGDRRTAGIRLSVNAVSLGFVAFFVLQGVLADTSRFFAAPAGACMLVMVGIAAEHLAALAGLALPTALRRPR